MTAPHPSRSPDTTLRGAHDPTDGTSSGAASYEAVAARTWRLGALQGLEGTALRMELVRYATLAPSSHNTQCWKFGFEDQAIVIAPDLSRRCPVVDSDDHHVFVSLGCAAENLVQAALAHGFKGEATFDSARDALRIALTPTAAVPSPLFNAIPRRQCTRAECDVAKTVSWRAAGHRQRPLQRCC